MTRWYENPNFYQLEIYKKKISHSNTYMGSYRISSDLFSNDLIFSLISLSPQFGAVSMLPPPWAPFPPLLLSLLLIFVPSKRNNESKWSLQDLKKALIYINLNIKSLSNKTHLGSDDMSSNDSFFSMLSWSKWFGDWFWSWDPSETFSIIFFMQESFERERE